MSKRLLFACMLFALNSMSNTQSFGLVLARAAEGMDISVPALGGLRTLENVASIVAALLVAPLIDRVPRKWPLAAGTGLAMSAALTLAVVGSARVVPLYFILNGTAVMITIATLLSVPSDYLEGRALHRVMGFLVGAFSLSSILMLPIVGAVADRAGWQAGFSLTAGMAALSCLVALLIVPKSHPRASSSNEDAGYFARYRGLLGNRSLLLALGSAFLRFTQFGALYTFLSAILIARYDLSLSRIGLIMSVGGVMFFLGSVGSGAVLERLGMWRTLVYGGLLTGTMFGLAYLRDPGVVVMVAAVLVAIFLLGFQENASTVLVLNYAGSARGAAMSWNELSAASGAMAGIGLGSVGLSLASASGLGAVLVLLATLGSVGSVIALRTRGSAVLETPALAG